MRVCLMEGRKNHSSLPTNYVSLAQLQERWLKQQTQINQPQPQQHNPIAPTIGNASSSSPPHNYVVKNRNDSQTHRRKSHSGAVIGDETARLNGKLGQSNKDKKKNKKNRKVNRKPKTEERGTSGEGSGTVAQGTQETEKKATIESELKEKKNGASVVTTEEAEQSFVVSLVEQRVRVLSMDSGNGKRNGRLVKMNKGFRDFPSQRKYYGANGNGQHSKVGVQKTEKKMVWVKKDEIVG